MNTRITTEGFVEIAITPPLLDFAKLYIKDIQYNKQKTIAWGQEIYGAIGEMALWKYALMQGSAAVHASSIGTYDYDLLIDGDRVEVKSKVTTARPKEDYVCSVDEKYAAIPCDYYAFTRIMKNKSKLWLLGWIQRDNFYKIASFQDKGFKDPSNGFTSIHPSYNCKISDLERYG